MRREILQQLHHSHMGMEKTKQRARSVVYWPGINRNIEEMISQCITCDRLQMQPRKHPLINTEIPEYPWERIGADIFSFRGEEHLIIVDYYSRYFEVDKLTSMTSKAVIQKMKPHFARFGIPRMLMTDNGPQFSSAEFSTFAKEWGIKHITSSPHHSQSNGLAEKTVQTAKRIIEKSYQSGTEPYLAFLEYRNTPVDNLASPAQLLMSRQLRSMLPAHPNLYKPKLVPSVQFKEARYYHQNLQKKYFDRGTENTCSLQPRQPVWIKVVPGKNGNQEESCQQLMPPDQTTSKQKLGIYTVEMRKILSHALSLFRETTKGWIYPIVARKRNRWHLQLSRLRERYKAHQLRDLQTLALVKSSPKLAAHQLLNPNSCRLSAISSRHLEQNALLNLLADLRAIARPLRSSATTSSTCEEGRCNVGAQLNTRPACCLWLLLIYCLLLLIALFFL